MDDDLSVIGNQRSDWNSALNLKTDNSHPSMCDVSCACRRDELSLSDSVAAQLRTVAGWVMNTSAVIICRWRLITVVK